MTATEEVRDITYFEMLKKTISLREMS